jgi:hypothetical protein
MHAMITTLTFSDSAAADAEVAEMADQAARISGLAGFVALLVVRVAPRQVVIVRTFDTAEGVGRSLGGRLRPDLAAHFASAPTRLSGEVALSRFGPDPGS